jgi:hypothetical protein
MNRSGRSLAFALIIGVLAVMPVLAADTAAPSADPGEEIKQGFVSFGHGVRDGAVKVWGAVKSAVNGNGSGDSSDKKAPPKKAAPGTDQK